MKVNVFYVSEETLIEAIRHLYPDKIKSKDYEYLISIYVKKIFEKHDGKTYKITFETNYKRQEVNGARELNTDEVVEILRNQLKENTDVDFGLAPVKENGEFENYSYPFQVKRFIGFSKENFLEELVEFVEEKAGHYKSPETSLIVVVEFAISKEDIKKASLVVFSEAFFRSVAKNLEVPGASLRSIVLFSINKKDPVLTQVWPNYGEY